MLIESIVFISRYYHVSMSSFGPLSIQAPLATVVESDDAPGDVLSDDGIATVAETRDFHNRVVCAARAAGIGGMIRDVTTRRASVIIAERIVKEYKLRLRGKKWERTVAKRARHWKARAAAFVAVQASETLKVARERAAEKRRLRDKLMAKESKVARISAASPVPQGVPPILARGVPAMTTRVVVKPPTAAWPHVQEIRVWEPVVPEVSVPRVVPPAEVFEHAADIVVPAVTSPKRTPKTSEQEAWNSFCESMQWEPLYPTSPEMPLLSLLPAEFPQPQVPTPQLFENDDAVWWYDSLPTFTAEPPMVQAVPVRAQPDGTFKCSICQQFHGPKCTAVIDVDDEGFELEDVVLF